MCVGVVDVLNTRDARERRRGSIKTRAKIGKIKGTREMKNTKPQLVVEVDKNSTQRTFDDADQKLPEAIDASDVAQNTSHTRWRFSAVHKRSPVSRAILLASGPYV